MFAAVCTSAMYAATWPLRPLPARADVEALGGRHFLRPSDGKIMEYWLSGQDGASTVIVFCHRMDGKLGCDYGRSKVDAMLRSRNACLISPSIPSLSASPPYDTDTPTKWLKQWNEDMLQLLHELRAEHVYVVGLSWGAQLCLSRRRPWWRLGENHFWKSGLGPFAGVSALPALCGQAGGHVQVSGERVEIPEATFRRRPVLVRSWAREGHELLLAPMVAGGVPGWV
mmetsp:Transcript_60357/g.134638  ORF Transcript_60357/g.134638 Transcript_60357/m.134638 type:complete len:227 (-) Transcript_60357:258-938(-)